MKIMRSTQIITFLLIAAFLLPAIGGAMNTDVEAKGPAGDVTDHVDPSVLDLSPPVKYDPQKRFLGDDAGRILDPYLEKVLAAHGDQDRLQILVQFKGSVTDRDLRALNELSFTINRTYHAIPAVWALGTKEAIIRLSGYERTFWIEYNEKLHYLMDGTTTVINATKVWNSVVIDDQGKIEPSTRYKGIDGSGVVAVVLDSGIDAGHPDLNNGKVIENLKSDNGDGPWYALENSDTSSGHGTHCAGTVAGNGDASGGARAGVAPGANLIGLSTGELVFITGAVGGLQWVYDHTRPGNNHHGPKGLPIRVVSNSWGAGGGEYDPKDAISMISEKIVYENNVNVVFAAGNSGGDGSDIQSSNYGNVPANICVAALEHDGGGVASFSSRGEADLNGTWPDVAAPGVKIMSTAARRTLISAMTKKGNMLGFDPYYFAISGTSMATPHVAGICALLWQANPYLKTSYVHEDYNGDSVPDFYNMTNTYVHETELILEAAAQWIPPADGNGVPDASSIPDNNTIGWTGKHYDFAQGYGRVMVDAAIGIALALKELRTMDRDHDGLPDYPNATVKMAYELYNGSMVLTNSTEATDTLVATWRGEWSRFTNDTNNPTPMTTVQAKHLYIPAEATKLILTLTYSGVDTTNPSLSMLSLVADLNGDGRSDWSQSGTDDVKRSEISLNEGAWSSAIGSTIIIDIDGTAKNFPFISYIQKTQYYEVRVEYSVSAEIVLGSSNSSIVVYPVQDPHAGYAQFKPGTPSPSYSGETLVYDVYAYDMRLIIPREKATPAPQPEKNFPWIALVLVLVALMALAIIFIAVYRKWFHPDRSNSGGAKPGV